MRAFFARPRKFGKSLTLDVAAEMLAAGVLPPRVEPWPGFVPVDVDSVFGGLEVHERLRKGDPHLRGLLTRAHFVVKLGLGTAQTGANLGALIIRQAASIAGSAFGSAIEAKVLAASEPGDAIETLISAVPRGVPVAVLVDEYDSAIIQDVTKMRWAAADTGIEALRSLLMATKSLTTGPRIERFLVTGVARFTRTSLFSGANNFVDLTDSPLMSRVLGFSEAEIRYVFPAELERLADSLRTDVDGAVAELTRWYNGYSFDGVTTCFNPYPVLVSLRAGTITERELEAASGTNWLSLTPADVVDGLATELQASANSEPASVDIADLEARRVRAVPLLLQTGLLSLVAGHPLQCRPPNEYARRSLRLMVSNALAVKPVSFFLLRAALRDRDRAAFEAAVTLLFEQIPKTLARRTSAALPAAPDAKSRPASHQREAAFHTALFGALLASAEAGVSVRLQVAVLRGIADIVLEFEGRPGAPRAVWVIEVGQGTMAATAKLPQAQQYAKAFLDVAELVCCGVVVEDAPSASTQGGKGKGPLVTFAGSRRAATAGAAPPAAAWELSS